MNPPSQPGAGIGYNFSLGDRVGGGRYLLKRLLGRGQCSEVWLAQDIREVKPVALKFLPTAFLSDANLIERLRQDTQRLVLLKHPHIVTTYDFVQDYSTIAIASEFIDGWSLATLKVDKPGNSYSVAEIGPWIQQLCDALAFAHSEIGIIHSDLKPANLLITAKEELKVSDFELANLVRLECSRRGIAKGLNAGLGFLSPQRALGEAPSKLDDIYSLGATIFDLFTGTPPFYKGEIFAQICSLKAPSISARIKELNLQCDPIPPVWEDTVARCLEKNPADRPQSIGAFLDLLKRTELLKPTPTVRAVPPLLPPVQTPSSPSAPPVVPEPSTASAEASNPPVAASQTPAPPASDSTPVVRPLASPTPGAATRAPSAKMAILLFTVVILLLAVIAGAAVFFALRQGAKSAAHLITNAITNSIIVSSTQTGSAGSLDQTFATGDGANDQVHAFAVQPDGKILVGGKFVTFNGAPHHGIVRLNPDGSIDTAFDHQTPSLVNSIAMQPDGKIFIAGGSMIKGHPGSRILRLNRDSSVDKSFKYGLGINTDVRAILLQPDGQILAGGNFTVIAKRPQNHFVRLAPGAALDDAFDANIAFPAAVFSLALQPDGKIIVGGLFTSSTGAGHIARLNPDGTADPQFNPGTGADNNVIAIALQPDGAILIGGNFTAVNQRSFPHLARLNPDGTVDTTFEVGAGPEKAVQAIAVQPDGKILIGGDFSTYQNESCPRIARLNPDGSLDKTFDPGTGANGMIQTLVLQPDGKVLIGGDFTSFNNATCNHLARLNNSFATK